MTGTIFNKEKELKKKVVACKPCQNVLFLDLKMKDSAKDFFEFHRALDLTRITIIYEL